MQRIVIIANGELPDLVKARTILRKDDYILCADGGTRHARALGLTPNLVVGDMDSIQKAERQELEQAGVPIELFPRDKNETDLELAIRRAVELDPQEILVVAALGGRFDQALGNIALLSDVRLSTLRQGSAQALDIRLDDGVEEIFFCREQVQVHGRSGDIVSLIPWGTPVHGVRTKNLRWILDDETLQPEKTRGISNEMISEMASIEIGSGLLLIIHRRKS